MNFRIISTPNFEKEAKVLQKKYPSFRSDLIVLAAALLKNPRQGVEVYKNCYKVRFPIKSKGRGKSGGGRLITCVKVTEEKIFTCWQLEKQQP